MFISKLIKGVALAGLLLPALAMGQSALHGVIPSEARVLVVDDSLLVVSADSTLRFDPITGRASMTIGSMKEVVFDLGDGAALSSKKGVVSAEDLGGEELQQACSGLLNAAVSAMTSAAYTCGTQGQGSTACRQMISVAQDRARDFFDCLLGDLQER
jgi:hypothetical protein